VKPLAALATLLALLALPARAGEPTERSRGRVARCGLEFLPPEASGRACLGCHEQGEAAPHVATHTSHPVDVEYRLTRRRASPLRSAAAALARGVVMPDGQVTCLSCHARGSRERHHLRLPQDEGPLASRLCNACHVMPGDEEGLRVAQREVF